MIYPWKEVDFNLNTRWFTGNSKIQTYQLEELLGIKIRALYQRKKGRDLYNLYKALTMSKVDINKVITCYY